MNNYIIVFIGAGFGGILRYWASNVVYKILPADFPYGTLLVNVLGSFIIGIVMFYFNENRLISPQLRILLTVGFCGGLTTFSTFSFETINLLKEREYLFASLNILSNVLLTLIVLFVVYKISKFIS
ncbi:MAG: fluoride efflux transporter CrcB [Melioribacteraceae bacterium]|nr:fluoride efflux transporter CrcB [Melioribacteraceae bacterium]